MRLKEKNIEFVCPICGGEKFSYKFSGKDYWYHTNNDKLYDIVECDCCKLECVYPMPTFEEQQSFYPTDYYSYIETNKIEMSNFRRLLSRIGSQCLKFFSSLFNHKKLSLPVKNGSGKNFLDIGCGAGENLKLMLKRGWNVNGFEISIKNEYKNNIYYGPSITEVKFFEKYDYIWCNHVFEHVYNPVEFLEKCNSILKDDGIMVMNLPNVVSFVSKFWGKYAVERDIPRHLFGYNYKNIQTLFEKSGFEIMYKFYQQNYGGYQSFSRYLYDKYGFDIGNNIIVGYIFLGFDLLLSFFKPTNSMGFVLKKKICC